ncbi:flagellar basal-body rod protein FlgC [Roseateles sp. YR242]|uniref:flagellar basal body rod protein FlgC n=1 Tax=Roseateles sp. YR242 TaxID=1855305 RepID=UPI0008C822C9|nr:flagellar basal body rod protein FlgC [Roseateles sp. YR242]SEK93160.1 flagellar basal-body rod protein FlgC [Roseateles sp. YR242]
MNYAQSFAISATGMDVERLRVEVAALNLANANTVSFADGRGFQPLRVVAQSAVGLQPMDGNGFASLVGQGLAGPTAVVEPNGRPARTVLDPGHPQADAQGYVSYPGVDTATEMMTMLGASRAYEANVAAMNITRSMATKALEIGGNS